MALCRPPKPSLRCARSPWRSATEPRRSAGGGRSLELVSPLRKTATPSRFTRRTALRTRTASPPRVRPPRRKTARPSSAIRLAHSCARPVRARRRRAPTAGRGDLRAAVELMSHAKRSGAALVQQPAVLTCVRTPPGSCHACAVFLSEDFWARRGFPQRTGELQQAPAAGGGRKPMRTTTASGRTGGTALAD